MSAEKGLTVTETQITAEFPILTADLTAMQEAIEENLGGAEISPFDLDRIKIPSAGGLTWSVPSLEGEKETKEILGIIVNIQNARAYWASEFAGGDLPPDCTSHDAVMGVGNPGGPCADCPYSVFGSDSRKRGQACKLIQRHFILRPDDNLPVVINLPPGSLKEARKYLLRLVSAGLSASAVVTSYTLTKDKNKDGITFSKAALAMKGKLDAPQVIAAKAYAKALKPIFGQVRVEDFHTEDDV